MGRYLHASFAGLVVVVCWLACEPTHRSSRHDDDDDDSQGGSGNQGANNQGGSNQGGSGNQGNQGGSGNQGACAPVDDCETCAAAECPDEALACCMAPGCRELVRCVAEKCGGGLTGTEQQVCAATNCSNELAAAGGIRGPGTAAAQELAPCVTPALMMPSDCPDGPCATCPSGFGGNPCGG